MLSGLSFPPPASRRRSSDSSPVASSCPATRGWRSELAPSHFSRNRRDSRNDRLKCPIIVRRGCRFWHFWFGGRPPRARNLPRASGLGRRRTRRAGSSGRGFVKLERTSETRPRTRSRCRSAWAAGPGASPTPTTIFQGGRSPGRRRVFPSWSPTANFLVATSWACDADNVLCYEVQANGQAVPKAAIKHDASVLCSAWNHDGSAVFSGAIRPVSTASPVPPASFPCAPLPPPVLSSALTTSPPSDRP